mmetsp:Transcript_8492/g.20863  ORF Transcript_8492/g.20863 Transcript_8492/m.20863 type:complete len:145 (-) Transcript_8492:505-939(-)
MLCRIGEAGKKKVPKELRTTTPNPMFRGAAIHRNDSDGAVAATEAIDPTMSPVPTAARKRICPPRYPIGLIINPIPAVDTAQASCFEGLFEASSMDIQIHIGAMPQMAITPRLPNIPRDAILAAMPVLKAIVAEAAVMPSPPRM